MTESNFIGKAVRGLACLLAVTTTLVCAAPREGWAMLVPAETAGSAAPGPSLRAADMATVERALASDAVRGKLLKLGFSEQETRSRLDRLTDQEIRQLASEVDALNPGGDSGLLVGLLVVAVLVLLIVYLVKRV